MTTDQTTLKRARMALAQAVTRSRAGSYPDRRAAATHRDAAKTRLRRGGREDLAVRLDASRDPTSAATRQTCREVMQLIDAELALSTPRAAADGGQR